MWKFIWKPIYSDVRSPMYTFVKFQVEYYISICFGKVSTKTMIKLLSLIIG